MSKTINVLELFAGVGGFRVGLESADENIFKTLWANQWEPSRKSQDAFEVYDYHFRTSENINRSIEDITDEDFKKMNADLIVGGFPCQDYSVARGKHNEQGIEGKKGVLFWEIIRATKIIKPKYLILENVDRLLKSPSTQRGRDFAIMLAAFNELGYTVEWRVINGAEYGRPQRRKRVFFFIFRNDSKQFSKVKYQHDCENQILLENYLLTDGLFATQFPIQSNINKERKVFMHLEEDLLAISESFRGVFWNTGIMTAGNVLTIDTIPNYTGSELTLGDIVEDIADIPKKFFLNKEKLEKFEYLRGAKKINRTSKDGHEYLYSEGKMSKYDELDKPSRTMLTSEGTTNRSTHILKQNGIVRLITPIEAERLQDFPDDWTKFKLQDNKKVLVPDRMRMFFMGNALITEIVRSIGNYIKDI